MLVSFTEGINEFITGMFMVFVSGTILGSFMEKYGSGQVIGDAFVKKFGVNSAPWAVMFLTGVLCAGGITMYMFTVIPIALALLKAANLPRYIGLTAMAAIAPIFMCLVPGIPIAFNALPTSYLGTNLFSGALVGVVATVVALTLCILYTRYLVKDARKKSIGYTPMPGGDANLEDIESLPSLLAALAPIVLVIVVSIIMSQGFDFDPTHAVFYAQIAGILLCVALNWQRIKNKSSVMTTALPPVVETVIATGCLGGFGKVVATTSAFQAMLGSISSFDMNPYVLTVVCVALLSFACSNGAAGMIGFLSPFAPALVAMPNVNLGAVHRLAAMTSNTLDTLPHAGPIVMGLRLFGLTHNEGYKHQFVVTLLIPIVYTVVSLVVCLILY